MQPSHPDAPTPPAPEDLAAELAAKNEELEHFIYTVSHDLKSPLVTIRGFLGLLEKDLAAGDSERVARDVERIHGAAERLGRLLGDLLKLSRVARQMNPSPAVDLGEPAREALGRLAGRLRERGARVEIASDLPAVSCDRKQLIDVFDHLIGNAVKFMGDQPEPLIEVGRRPDAGAVVCIVRDNGIGIEKRHLGEIFGLFDRLDNDVEGNGFGLALVKRIVELHGGRAWAESEGKGRGSTFCFSLPRSATARSQG